jgi:gamma-glutamyltranspeptidase/glutathione hydrolase
MLHGLQTQCARGSRYAVACGCKEATAAAVQILESGGNVVDAALAASAVLCVALPQAVSIGGDLFALVKAGPHAKAVAVNATGSAPLEASIEAFRARGHDLIPAAGPLSIQTPGLVAGWQILADRWASRPLAQLLKPAIGYARDGVSVTRRLQRYIADAAPAYGTYHGFRETFSNGPSWLKENDTWVQPQLARTLEAIAANGAAGFYDGWVAEDIVRTVRAAGGLLSERDFQSVEADVGEPLSVRFRNVEVLTQPPVSQGVILLRALHILGKRVEAPERLSLPEYWRAAADAIQTAFRERLALLGDEPGMIERSKKMILAPFGGTSENPDAASAPQFANTGPDTTTLAIVDREGNAVSIIQSVFADLGCGVVSRESGVLLNNRLSAFFLDPSHPNALRPGRRTMQTLHSMLVQQDGAIRWAGGTPGGDVQPQVNLQILARLIDHGQSLEEAIAAPRWALMPGTSPLDIAQQQPHVRIDPELDPETRRMFADRGLKIEETADHNVGSVKIVQRAENGNVLEAWCDHRRNAVAAAG